MRPRNLRERNLVKKAQHLLEMAHLTVDKVDAINKGLQGSWLGKGDAAALANQVCSLGGSGRPKFNGKSYATIAFTAQGSGPDVVLAPETQIKSGRLDPSKWIAIELKTGGGDWQNTEGNFELLDDGTIKFGKSGSTASAAWTAIYNNPTWRNIKSALMNPDGTWITGFINNLQGCTYPGAVPIDDVRAALDTTTPLPGDHAIVYSVGEKYLGISFGGLTVEGFINGDNPVTLKGTKSFTIKGQDGEAGTLDLQNGWAIISKVKFDQGEAEFVADLVLSRQSKPFSNWSTACKTAGIKGSKWDLNTIAAFILWGATTPYSGDPETIYGSNHWAVNGKSAAEVKAWHARSIPTYTRAGSSMGLVFAVLSYCYGVPYVPAGRRTEAWVQTCLFDQTKIFAEWVGRGGTL